MELATIMSGNWSWIVISEDGKRETAQGSLKVYGDYVIIGGNMWFKPKRVRPQ